MPALEQALDNVQGTLHSIGDQSAAIVQRIQEVVAAACEALKGTIETLRGQYVSPL